MWCWRTLYRNDFATALGDIAFREFQGYGSTFFNPPVGGYTAAVNAGKCRITHGWGNHSWSTSADRSLLVYKDISALKVSGGVYCVGGIIEPVFRAGTNMGVGLFARFAWNKAWLIGLGVASDVGVWSIHPAGSPTLLAAAVGPYFEIYWNEGASSVPPRDGRGGADIDPGHIRMYDSPDGTTWTQRYDAAMGTDYPPLVGYSIWHHNSDTVGQPGDNITDFDYLEFLNYGFVDNTLVGGHIAEVYSQ